MRATTNLGLKIVMGISGLIWIVFVVSHVIGNLLVFAGPGTLNRYSAFLHGSTGVLWSVRAVIYGALLCHVGAGLLLWRSAARARRVEYVRPAPQASTVASRTIRWTGLLVLAFVVFHILHLTTGTLSPVPFDGADVYGNVTRGFRVPWVAGVYVAAMVAVSLHVLHGTYAFSKSLGWTRLRADPFDRRLAIGVGLGVWIGFTVIPLAVFTGALRPQ